MSPVVGRVGGECRLLEDRAREQTLQRFDGGTRAADVHIERAVQLRIDVDDLEGRVVRPLPSTARQWPASAFARSKVWTTWPSKPPIVLSVPLARNSSYGSRSPGWLELAKRGSP